MMESGNGCMFLREHILVLLSGIYAKQSRVTPVLKDASVNVKINQETDKLLFMEKVKIEKHQPLPQC